MMTSNPTAWCAGLSHSTFGEDRGEECFELVPPLDDGETDEPANGGENGQDDQGTVIIPGDSWR